MVSGVAKPTYLYLWQSFLLLIGWQGVETFEYLNDNSPKIVFVLRDCLNKLTSFANQKLKLKAVTVEFLH